jgi:chromosome partitioning protein
MKHLPSVSVINFKGGTGKSSLTENLGYALAQSGRRVLIVDGDRQRNSTTTLLGGNYTTPTIKEVIEGNAQLEDAIRQAHYEDEIGNEQQEDRVRENLFIVPSHPDLEKASVFLSANRKAFYIVRNGLRNLKQPFDFVLIDHAGAYSPVMEALLLASDGIIIPCELEPYCVRGIFDMYAKLKDELPDHTLANFGIIPYAINWSKSMTRLYMDQLREAFGELVIQSVRTDANLPKAQSNFETIFEFEPRSNCVKDFLALAQVIDGLKEEVA